MVKRKSDQSPSRSAVTTATSPSATTTATTTDMANEKGGKFTATQQQQQQQLKAVHQRAHDLIHAMLECLQSEENSSSSTVTPSSPLPLLKSPSSSRRSAKTTTTTTTTTTTPAYSQLQQRWQRREFASLQEFQLEVEQKLPKSLPAVRRWIARYYQLDPPLLMLSTEEYQASMQTIVGRPVVTEVQRQRPLIVEQPHHQPPPSQSEEPTATSPADTASAAAVAGLESPVEDGASADRPKRSVRQLAKMAEEAAAAKEAEAMQPPAHKEPTTDALGALSKEEQERLQRPGQGTIPPKYALVMKSSDQQLLFTSLRKDKAKGPIPVGTSLSIDLFILSCYPPAIPVSSYCLRHTVQGINIMAAQPTMLRQFEKPSLSGDDALHLRIEPPLVRQKARNPVLGEVCPPLKPETVKNKRASKKDTVVPVFYLDNTLMKSFAPVYDSSGANINNELSKELMMGVRAMKKQRVDMVRNMFRSVFGTPHSTEEKTIPSQMSSIEDLPSAVGDADEVGSVASVDGGAQTLLKDIVPGGSKRIEELLENGKIDLDEDKESIKEDGDEMMDVDLPVAEPTTSTLLGPEELSQRLHEEGIDLDTILESIQPLKALSQKEASLLLEETASLLVQLHKLQNQRVISVPISEGSFRAITEMPPLNQRVKSKLKKLVDPTPQEMDVYQKLEKNLVALTSSTSVHGLFDPKSLQRLRQLDMFLGAKEPVYRGTIAPGSPKKMDQKMAMPTGPMQQPMMAAPSAQQSMPHFTAAATAAAPPTPVVPIQIPGGGVPFQIPGAPPMTPQQSQQFYQTYMANILANFQKMQQGGGASGGGASATPSTVFPPGTVPAGLVNLRPPQPNMVANPMTTASASASASAAGGMPPPARK